MSETTTPRRPRSPVTVRRPGAEDATTSSMSPPTAPDAMSHDVEFTTTTSGIQQDLPDLREQAVALSRRVRAGALLIALGVPLLLGIILAVQFDPFLGLGVFGILLCLSGVVRKTVEQVAYSTIRQSAWLALVIAVAVGTAVVAATGTAFFETIAALSIFGLSTVVALLYIWLRLRPVVAVITEEYQQ